jgi:hypothetical protein
VWAGENGLESQQMGSRNSQARSGLVRGAPNGQNAVLPIPSLRKMAGHGEAV